MISILFCIVCAIVLMACVHMTVKLVELILSIFPDIDLDYGQVLLLLAMVGLIASALYQKMPK